ncbi:hypothetical protein PMAYCL1PPCAC_22220, partial [Pristionchus mayeri]
NSALDKECVQGETWMITPDNYWSYGDQWMGTSTIYIYCTTQLQQPTGDGCDTFADDGEDGVCYQVSENAQSWQDAQTTCRDMGATMASIHNQQENSFIRRLAVSKGAVNGLFLGGSIAGKGNQFGWIDGTTWDYDNFYPSFPIGGNGECLTMDTFAASGQWMNIDCGTSFPVACARQAEARPACKPGPWKEGEVIYSPGFPYDATTPCDYFLTVDDGKRVEVEVLVLEANSCCDRLVMEDDVLGGNIVANLTGEVADKIYTTASSNLVRVSWQPDGGVNVRGMMVSSGLIHASCPSGFELVRDGECRGQQSKITSSFAQASTNVISQCASIGGKPIIIHNAEHHYYWRKTAPPTNNGYMILGLICNSNTRQWQWADGSGIDYKPIGGNNGYN